MEVMLNLKRKKRNSARAIKTNIPTVVVRKENKNIQITEITKVGKIQPAIPSEKYSLEDSCLPKTNLKMRSANKQPASIVRSVPDINSQFAANTDQPADNTFMDKIV